MANRLKGEASFTTSDGRTLTLRYDFDALSEVEDAADKSIGEVLAEIGKGAPRLKTARALIYGGLRAHHPDMELADASDLILSDGLAVTEAMQKALAAAFPQAEEGKEPANPPSRRRGTGSRS